MLLKSLCVYTDAVPWHTWIECDPWVTLVFQGVDSRYFTQNSNWRRDLRLSAITSVTIQHIPQQTPKVLTGLCLLSGKLVLFNPIMQNFEEDFLPLSLLLADTNAISLHVKSCRLLCVTDQRMEKRSFCPVEPRRGRRGSDL